MPLTLPLAAVDLLFLVYDFARLGPLFEKAVLNVLSLVTL